jgi:hypothetical protein
MLVHCSRGNRYVLFFWRMVLGLNGRRSFHSRVVRGDQSSIPDHLLTISVSSFDLGPIFSYPKVSIHCLFFRSIQTAILQSGSLRDRLCGPSGFRLYRGQLSCCVVLLPS